MKSICYIVPFFGKLPQNFQLWLVGCKANKTVNWIVITDDHTKYIYPDNVRVIYTSYKELTERIQSHYDFKIDFSRPWRLALMKPAYGEIFSEELREYDFWGYCDIDLMWGDIRKFYTNELLERYDRIGRGGHSSIYRNTKDVNLRYKTIVPDTLSYKDVFSGASDWSFDENGLDAIYNYLGLPYYEDDRILMHLAKFESGFYVLQDTRENQRYQLLTWKNGRIFRHHIVNGKVEHEELMYVHFWCRPMKYNATHFDEKATYYMYPDIMTDKDLGDVNSVATLKKYGHRSKIGFLINMAWVNRHKINTKRIINNLRYIIKFRKKKNGSNDSKTE